MKRAAPPAGISGELCISNSDFQTGKLLLGHKRTYNKNITSLSYNFHHNRGYVSGCVHKRSSTDVQNKQDPFHSY